MLLARVPRAVVAFLGALLTSSVTLHGATRSPNILLILADDLGYGEVSYNGQQHYTTPNLDRLAGEGMVFSDFYAGSPICAPSRNCLMTGEHTGHSTVRNNFAGGGRTRRIALKRTDVTIAERLSHAGYATGLIGKWGLGEEDTPSAPWLRGWDFFYGFVNQTHAHNHFPEFLYRNSEKVPLVGNYGHRAREYAQDLFTNEALQFLERQGRAEKPFFLCLAYTLPHADVAIPPDAVEDAVRRFPKLRGDGAPEGAATFAAMVMRLDRDVGRLVQRLKELGMDENTVIMFTSDNGAHREGGKDPAWFRSSGPFRGIKRDLYEGGIREPFFARWPGRITPGSRSNHVAAFWDFPATALELAGVPRPSDLPADGISFAPTLLGHTAGQESHASLYWEIVIQRQARQAVREGTWKAVRYGLDAPIALFDLSADVGEEHDIAAQHPERVAHLARIMEAAHTDNPDFPLTANARSAQPAPGSNRKRRP